ncbi:MAG TPA: efflux RND transporter periplasmic adaptor subunit [Steroidobacteraceae bacterium]|nr:efflux RND transporter periplasmic adaptor subunit [Steroidobacteraceae bacterium]
MTRSILPALAAGAALLCAALPATADDLSVFVQTTTVASGSLPRHVVAFGRVQPDPAGQLAFMAPIAATVADVYVRLGERVAKGAPLVELAPTPTTAAAYAAAVSADRVARDALVRTRQLRAQRLATEPQLAAAEKAETDARAARAALQAQGAGAPTTLRAPDAAVVTAIAVSAQAIVAEGTPLVVLARPNALVLLAGVIPAEALSIKAGDPALIAPIGGGGSFKGRVALRGGAVDPANGLVPVDVTLPADALLPGESAQVTITTGEVRGWVVPHQAVLVDDTGSTYVVQVEGGVAKTVPVHVLLADGARDIVAGTIDHTAPLVLAGAYQLQNGMKVRFGTTAAQAAR